MDLTYTCDGPRVYLVGRHMSWGRERGPDVGVPVKHFVWRQPARAGHRLHPPLRRGQEIDQGANGPERVSHHVGRIKSREDSLVEWLLRHRRVNNGEVHVSHARTRTRVSSSSPCAADDMSACSAAGRSSAASPEAFTIGTSSQSPSVISSDWPSRTASSQSIVEPAIIRTTSATCGRSSFTGPACSLPGLDSDTPPPPRQAAFLSGVSAVLTAGAGGSSMRGRTWESQRGGHRTDAPPLPSRPY